MFIKRTIIMIKLWAIVVLHYYLLLLYASNGVQMLQLTCNSIIPLFLTPIPTTVDKEDGERVSVPCWFQRGTQGGRAHL